MARTPELSRFSGSGCPYCNAKPGEHCRTRTGRIADAGYSVHVRRRTAWYIAGRPALPDPRKATSEV